jgi:hypothetical protein
MGFAISAAVALFLLAPGGAAPGHAEKRAAPVAGNAAESTGGKQRPEISVSFYDQNGAPSAAAPPRMPPGTAGAHCPEEGRLRSTEGKTSTHVNFANQTGHAIRTYWLNYEGHRQFYAEIQPGTAYRQQTYLTHPWVVTDGSDNCLKIIMPAARETTHSIF